MTKTQKTIAVIGAGTMGRGIAQIAAGVGMQARLFDQTLELAQGGVDGVAAILNKRVKRGKISEQLRDDLLAAMTPTADLAAAVTGADAVIEAIPESMALKVKVFREVVEHCPADCLLASNTSSLSITELGQAIGQAERLIGLHFFNPPPVMALVEVVRGFGTSEGCLERALGLVAELGKTPIVVNDFPGFATSRLGVILGAEAARMVEQGVAGVQEIDRGMELGYRHPMGPLKLTDLVGLDVRLAILEHLHKELGEQFRPPALLRQMVRAGRLGKKTGLGFYKWTAEGPVPAPIFGAKLAHKNW